MTKIGASYLSLSYLNKNLGANQYFIPNEETCFFEKKILLVFNKVFGESARSGWYMNLKTIERVFHYPYLVPKVH